MKKCSKCGAFMYEMDVFCKSCGHENWTDEDVPNTPKKKPMKKTPYLIALLLLVPTLLLGIYAELDHLDLIPNHISLGDMGRLEFYSMGENEFMDLLAAICFFACPSVFLLAVAIIHSVRSSMVAKEEEEAYNAFYAAEREKAVNSPHNTVTDEGVERVAPKPIAPDPIAPKPATPVIEKPHPELYTFPALKRLEADFKDKIQAKQRAISDVKPAVFKNTAKQLVEFAASRGVAITPKIAYSVIAAVAADCVILTDDRQRDKSVALLSVVAEYFGGSLNPHSMGRGCTFPEQLALYVDRDNRVTETGLLIDMYKACLDRESLRFAYLDDFEPIADSDFIAPYVFAVENRHVECHVPVDKYRRGKGLTFINDDGSVTFPNNLRLVLAPTFGVSTSKLTVEAIYLDVTEVASCDATEYIGSTEAGTFLNVVKAADQCRDVHYLSEDTWKKIDKLEEYLNGVVGYSFNNRKTRIMERYSSAYIAAGGTEAEALDSMLVSCVLNELYPKRGKFKSDGEDDIVTFLENDFGAETVPNSIEIVRKFYSAVVEEESEAETVVEETATAEPEAETVVEETATAEPETEVVVEETETAEPEAEVVVEETVTAEPETEVVVEETETAEPEAEVVVEETVTAEPEIEVIVDEAVSENNEDSE